MVDPFRLEKANLYTPVSPVQRSFRELPRFQTAGESVLITDPTYLADVYGSSDVVARFVREHGVIVSRFGGDVSCPVWWQYPYLMLLLTRHTEEDDPPDDVTIIPDVVGCDSGSFLFLPLSERMPCELKTTISTVLERRSGVTIPLMKGIWTIWYEYASYSRGVPRKIVVRWEPDPDQQPGLPLGD